MPLNPPDGSQHIVPYVYYDDPRAATTFLCDVFGFEQTMMLEWTDGSVAHAEVAMSGERVMIGAADPRFGLVSAQAFGAVHTVLASTSETWTRTMSTQSLGEPRSFVNRSTPSMGPHLLGTGPGRQSLGVPRAA